MRGPTLAPASPRHHLPPTDYWAGPLPAHDVQRVVTNTTMPRFAAAAPGWTGGWTHRRPHTHSGRGHRLVGRAAGRMWCPEALPDGLGTAHPTRAAPTGRTGRPLAAASVPPGAPQLTACFVMGFLEPAGHGHPPPGQLERAFDASSGAERSSAQGRWLPTTTKPSWSTSAVPPPPPGAPASRAARKTPHSAEAAAEPSRGTPAHPGHTHPPPDLEVKAQGTQQLVSLCLESGVRPGLATGRGRKGATALPACGNLRTGWRQPPLPALSSPSWR